MNSGGVILLSYIEIIFYEKPQLQQHNNIYSSKAASVETSGCWLQVYMSLSIKVD